MLINKMLRVIAVLIAINYVPLVLAKKGDDKAPLHIDANNATFDQKQMVTVFNGNVVITKGTLKVRNVDQGIATEDKNGDRTLKLVGKPVSFIQVADDGETIEGQANQLDYNTKTSLAVLTGRSRVKKGKNVVIGDVLTYNTQTHVYSAQSTTASGVKKQSSGRITVILDGETGEKQGKK